MVHWWSQDESEEWCIGLNNKRPWEREAIKLIENSFRILSLTHSLNYHLRSNDAKRYFTWKVMKKYHRTRDERRMMNVGRVGERESKREMSDNSRVPISRVSEVWTFFSVSHYIVRVAAVKKKVVVWWIISFAITLSLFVIVTIACCCCVVVESTVILYMTMSMGKWMCWRGAEEQQKKSWELVVLLLLMIIILFYVRRVVRAICCYLNWIHFHCI